MFLKYSLIGLGGIAVVGGVGCMIYNATKSDSKNKGEETQSPPAPTDLVIQKTQ